MAENGFTLRLVVVVVSAAVIVVTTVVVLEAVRGANGFFDSAGGAAVTGSWLLL